MKTENSKVKIHVLRAEEKKKKTSTSNPKAINAKLECITIRKLKRTKTSRTRVMGVVQVFN